MSTSIENKNISKSADLKHSKFNSTNIVFLLLVNSLLTSCKSSYNTSFGCPDANGLNCFPLSVVDQRIDSGEIEEVELTNCRGKTCKQSRLITDKPRLQSQKLPEESIIIDEKLEKEKNLTLQFSNENGR